MKILKLGDRGKEVLDVQSRLCSLGFDVGTDGVDGYFGEDTRSAILLFQQESGLIADGVVAENTWCELVEAGYKAGERLLYLRIPPFRGADVLLLQRSLNCLGFNAGPEDGIFGDLTERAVLDFQKNSGLVMDGMVDDSVLRIMAKVTKDGEPHSTEAKIPDRNGGYAAGRSLADLTVTIDPGHGGDESGAVAPSGVNEKDLNLTVAQDLARALEGLGSKVVLTREGDISKPLYDRPAMANAAGADIFISIHHNFLPEGGAQAAAAYYFCRQGYFSEAGSLLAQHILDNLSRELAVPAIPALGRNYAVLRETSMTAVMVEPSFIDGPGLSGLDPRELARRESEAILAGIREYFTT
ncbi:MAG: N-acetylmuramoyl-L-alanine amidase [Thermoleophilia bacterium]